jgi:hypothetical protein
MSLPYPKENKVDLEMFTQENKGLKSIALLVREENVIWSEATGTIVLGFRVRSAKHFAST